MKLTHTPTQEYQEAELRTLTPELGYFVVTGSLEDVVQARKSFHASNVTESTFDAALRGKSIRHRNWLKFGISFTYA